MKETDGWGKPRYYPSSHNSCSKDFLFDEAMFERMEGCVRPLKKKKEQGLLQMLMEKAKQSYGNKLSWNGKVQKLQ